MFLADYHLRDLREAQVEQILFRQHAGDVFEDPVAGVTEAALLPPDAPLAALANRVRAERASRCRGPVPDGLLSRTTLPQASIIGSLGSHLAAQADETRWFFDDLRRFATTWQLEENLGEIEQALAGFFHDTTAVADHGTLPGGEPTDTPIDRAFDELDRVAELKSELKPLLRDLVPEVDHSPLERGPDLSAVAADTPLDMLVLACALFLAGWNNLTQVRGWRSRALIRVAREILVTSLPVTPDR